tara:strand:+ start:2294 stop:2755 length:462 start_codon:yes stop_codon:yes gene_type:complete
MNSLLQQMPLIRNMRPSDLNQVVCIEREIFLFPWSLGNFADSIETGYFCQVLEQSDTLFGYGVMITGPDEAHILTIGIAANWQKKGWGSKLLQHFIQLAKQQNKKTILLDVRESNLGATNLYKQTGFKQIAIRKDYYPAMCGREDAIVMELLL